MLLFLTFTQLSWSQNWPVLHFHLQIGHCLARYAVGRYGVLFLFLSTVSAT